MKLSELIEMYSDLSSEKTFSAALAAKVVALALEWAKAECRMVNQKCVQPACVAFVHEGMTKFMQAVI